MTTKAGERENAIAKDWTEKERALFK